MEIHPDTAAMYGIGDGDEVIIETKYGAITQRARVTDIIHPRVVSAALGWWFPEGHSGDPVRVAEIQLQHADLDREIGEGIRDPEHQ